MATASICCDDQTLAQVCKALGCVVRIQILRYVLEHPDCIGNEILLHLPDGSPRAQSTLSQHLRVLRNAGLLEAFEDGSAICYRVNQEQLAWINRALERWSVEALKR
jgi:ArsR family transcriptional regulator, arsenate/arsenite/antimonite-responsive transcriptional repressor